MEQKMQLYRLFKVTRALSITLVATLILSACAASPKVFVNQDPNADFTKYKTYNFMARLGTDDKEGYHSILSQYLMNSTAHELEARGYVKASNPDLAIDFELFTQEKIRSTSSPSMSGGYRGGAYGNRGYGAYGSYDTTVTQYTEGTLSILLIDATTDKKQLVWEIAAQGRITDSLRKNLEERITAGVKDLFTRYPYYAAGFVPPEPAAPKK
jgi:hypothetical protein